MEEVKEKIFRHFNFPSELIPHFGFYQVVEHADFFDEVFIEDFVRPSDILAEWMIKSTRSSVYIGEPVVLSSKIFFTFRYYLMLDDPKSVLCKIEKCFLIADFYRFLYSNKVKVSKEGFVQAMSLLGKMRRVQIGEKETPALITETIEMANVYGTISGNSTLCNYKQILDEMKKSNDDKPSILKAQLINMIDQTTSSRGQFFRIKFHQETAKKYLFPIYSLLLINPVEFLILDLLSIPVFTARFDAIRQILQKDDSVYLIFDFEEEALSEPSSVDMISENKSKSISEIDNQEEEHDYEIRPKKKFIFSSNQARNIYQTFQNYIQLQATGVYNASKIDVQRLYKDTDQLDIKKEDIAKINHKKFSAYNVNRYFKKEHQIA